jgi:hypothetical protein
VSAAQPRPGIIPRTVCPVLKGGGPVPQNGNKGEKLDV